MPSRGLSEEQLEGGGETQRMLYCLVPGELALKLHDPLRRHFRDEPAIEVVVERRRADRRRAEERRRADAGPPGETERRRIRSVTGRRIAERRAAFALSGGLPPLPRRASPYADRISFVERLEPSGQLAEDHDTARLVTRFQAGDEAVLAILYRRYFERLYAYLRAMLRDAHEAEDATQQVFTKLLDALPDYERRSQPFRAWLFALARNTAISELRKRHRLEVREPSEIERCREPDPEAELVFESPILDWLTDRELMLFVERLPLAQRQVLMLRYMMGLANPEIAQVLGRTPTDIGKLHHRAVAFLRARLEAIGRAPRGRGGERIEWHRRTQRTQILRARRFALTWRA